MKRFFGVMVAVAGLATASMAFAADAAAVAKGKEVFTANKCGMCHSVAGVGNKKTPLDGVGAKLKEDQIRKWIVAPKEMKADVKKPDFTKIPKADLDEVVAYVASLK